ncbi:MAG: ChaN family lipoprotein [Myxococcales bacterium]|nr:ChaN family lipoprotein [Myxococcales bacterium]
MLRIPLVCSLLALFACGGASSSGVGAPPVLKVEEAGLPFHILRATNGREISPQEFFDDLREAQAICVGESHGDPHHHWAQLEILKVVAEEGGAFGTGLEMFQLPFQGVLDDYAEGTITEETMLARTDWKRRWTYDWDFYAPTVRLTIERGGAVLALNISKELKDSWKKLGTEGLSPEQRAKLPELDMDDAQHRTWFRTLMESMSEKHGSKTEAGGHALFVGDPEGPEGEHVPAGRASAVEGPEPENTDADAASVAESDFIDQIYPVQVLWDETMADTAAKWLLAQAGRRIVILAGHGHCRESAIIRRMRRRGITSVISVRPVVDTGKGEVADLLTAPAHSYLLVMEKLKK